MSRQNRQTTCPPLLGIFQMSLESISGVECLKARKTSSTIDHPTSTRITDVVFRSFMHPQGLGRGKVRIAYVTLVDKIKGLLEVRFSWSIHIVPSRYPQMVQCVVQDVGKDLDPIVDSYSSDSNLFRQIHCRNPFLRLCNNPICERPPVVARW